MKKHHGFLPAAVAAVFLLLMVLTISVPASAVESATFKSEPVVRIGILQKAEKAALEFEGEFRMFKADGTLEIFQGEDGKIKVEMYRVDMPQLESIWRVSLGKFRSFEQAEFIAGDLRSIPDRPQLAQPERWSLWFGPYRTRNQAENLVAMLAMEGYRDTQIEPVSQDLNVVSYYGPDGKLLHLGNTSVVFMPGNLNFLLDGRRYRGGVEITLDSYGTFSVINRVSTSDYLKSVLPREMPPLSHPESLRSQAVIARTYLLNNLRRHTIDGFNLCSNPDCQVYGGVPNEYETTTTAVLATRGVVLEVDGELVNTLFHSTCGGRTASYSDSWSGPQSPGLASVDDGSKYPDAALDSEKNVKTFLNSKEGFCNRSKYFRWTKKYSYSELQALLNETVPEFTNKPDLEIGQLQDVLVTAYSSSGRAQVLQVVTSNGTYTFEKDTIRWVLGILKSTLFVIEKSGSGSKTVYTIKGAGWGHGVGLCQIGAMQMGRDGKTYIEILNHYYPGATIKKIWF